MGESDPIAVQNAQVAGIITDQGEEPWMRNLSARPLPRKCGSSPWNWSEMDIRRQRSRMEGSWLRWTPRTRSLGRATCRTSLASWRAGSRRRPTRLRDAPRRIERRGFHEVMLVSKQTGKVLAAARYG